MSDETPDDPMTDDELVSAYLDGEVSAAERARVEGDPARQRRAVEFGISIDALHEAPPPLPADVRDRLRNHALDVAFGQPDEDAGAAGEDGDESEGGVASPVLPHDQLAARRRRRGPRLPVPRPAVAAAVIIVLLVLGLGLVFTDRGRSTDRASTSAGARDRAEQTPKASGASGAAEDRAGTPKAPRFGPSSAQKDASGLSRKITLGGFADQAALRTRLRQIDPGTLSETAAGGANLDQFSRAQVQANDRCDQLLRSLPGRDLGPPIASASATVGGRPVIVLANPVNGSSPRKIQLSALDAATCQVMFAVER
jgi:hypothetical protein